MQVRQTGSHANTKRNSTQDLGRCPSQHVGNWQNSVNGTDALAAIGMSGSIGREARAVFTHIYVGRGPGFSSCYSTASDFRDGVVVLENDLPSWLQHSETLLRTLTINSDPNDFLAVNLADTLGHFTKRGDPKFCSMA